MIWISLENLFRHLNENNSIFLGQDWLKKKYFNREIFLDFFSIEKKFWKVKWWMEKVYSVLNNDFNIIWTLI